MVGWRRGETLGRGGFGLVSIANKLDQEKSCDQAGLDHLPSVFAVKSVVISQSSSLVAEKKLFDKFKACPTIIRCYGDDTTTENGEEYYNIFLEYASGGCVVNRLRSMPKGLPENIVSQYTKSILIALSYIHKQGYVHRDVKPHNILLSRKEGEAGEVAKLADFGIAKKAARKLQDQGDSEEGFRGTPLYAAPETISRQEYEVPSDIWSLGCTVLHMISGKIPWLSDKDTDVGAILLRIICTDKLPEIHSRVSRKAVDFLKKCLVRDPQSRWTADMLLAHPFVSDAALRKSGHGEKQTFLAKVRLQKKAVSRCISALRPRWISCQKMQNLPTAA